jgi:hypothetical protein
MRDDVEWPPRYANLSQYRRDVVGQRMLPHPGQVGSNHNGSAANSISEFDPHATVAGTAVQAYNNRALCSFFAAHVLVLVQNYALWPEIQSPRKTTGGRDPLTTKA